MDIMQSEISQTEKVKNHEISLMCGIQNWKQQMNTPETQTTQTRFGGRQREGAGISKG